MRRQLRLVVMPRNGLMQIQPIHMTARQRVAMQVINEFASGVVVDTRGREALGQSGGRDAHGVDRGRRTEHAPEMRVHYSFALTKPRNDLGMLISTIRRQVVRCWHMHALLLTQRQRAAEFVLGNNKQLLGSDIAQQPTAQPVSVPLATAGHGVKATFIGQFRWRHRNQLRPLME